MPISTPTPRPSGQANKAGPGQAQSKIDLRIKELRMFDVSHVRDRWEPGLENLQKGVNDDLAEAFGRQSPEFKRFALDGFDATLKPDFSGRYTTEELQQAVKEGLEQAIDKLRRAKIVLAERAQRQPAAAPAAPAPAPAAAPAAAATRAAVPAAAPAPAAVPAKTAAPPAAAPRPAAAASSAPTRVAVIGPHDAQARDAAAAFIRQLGLQTTTLPAPSRLADGAYFDRLEGLSELQFAIVLVPAAALDAAAGTPQALPPELMLELGFLLGTLGRDRIAFLVSGPAAKAPPWNGAVGLPMDDAGVWHLLLARALKQAGLDVDLNRAV